MLLNYTSSDSDDNELQLWTQQDSIKTALETQDHDFIIKLFDSDLFHPPVAKMMSMGPTATSKFLQRNSSADWSHGMNSKNIRNSSANRKRAKSTRKFSIQDFEIGPVIGRGRFATVYLAHESAYGNIVALKVIEKSTITRYQLERSIRNEIEIQAHLIHDNIARIYGFFDDDQHICFMMEYVFCEKDLFSLVKEGPMEEKKAAEFMEQIVRAVKFMHDNCVIHRDIKLENILISEKGIVKLADFGWAIHALQSDKRVGTLKNLAPEMLVTPSSPYNNKIDIWALGIVLYQMLITNHPFPEENESKLIESILSSPIQIPSHISPSATQLIHSTLDRNPHSRIELTQVIDHHWIQGYIHYEKIIAI
jgi:serine/threonine protein kinase